MSNTLLAGRAIPRESVFKGRARLYRACFLAGLALISLGCCLYYTATILPASMGARATAWEGFYPEWIGCRQILARRNPYDAAATQQIQAGFSTHYGRFHSTDEQRFAYPAHFAFLVFLLALLPFSTAAAAALAACIFATVFSIGLWCRCFEFAPRTSAMVLLLTLGSFPIELALHLRQPTLLLAPLLAATVYAVRSERLVCGGMLAAFCTVKPQASIGVLLALVIWALRDWRQRKQFLVSFSCSALVLFSASEALVPGWLTSWLITIRAYAHYAGARPLLYDVVQEHCRVLATALLIALTLWVSYRYSQADLLFTVSFSIVAFQLVTPFLLYNGVLLLPATLWLLKHAARIPACGQFYRLLADLSWTLLAAGWISSVFLTAASLLLARSTLPLWQVPLLAAWLYPALLFGALLAALFSPLPTNS